MGRDRPLLRERVRRDRPLDQNHQTRRDQYRQPDQQVRQDRLPYQEQEVRQNQLPQQDPPSPDRDRRLLRELGPGRRRIRRRGRQKSSARCRPCTPQRSKRA